MKSQDLVLLFRLLSIWADERPVSGRLRTDAWQGWENLASNGFSLEPIQPFDSSYEDYRRGLFTVRQLASTANISKTQVSLSLQRSIDSGIAVVDRKTGLPKVNAKALHGLIVHAVKYVFPAKKGPINRGIPTAMAAPVLRDQILTGGDFVPVWPDPRGTTMGQAIEPLFEGVTSAVANDPMLYALLALTDAMRIGQPREQSIASENLREIMGV